MRLFVAVDLHTRTRELLTRKIKLLKDRTEGDIKWVRPENWHLTLKFLGEVKPERQKEIKNILDRVGSIHLQFSLVFRGIGAFPSLKYPKVLYIGVEKGKQELIKLHQNLEQEFREIGFKPEDRKFTPHLTIARGKKQSGIKDLADVITKFQDPYFINVHMDVNIINLIESKLYATGPEYIDIFTKKLQ